MQPDVSQSENTPAKSGDSCTSGSCCPLQKRGGLIFWGVLIFALLYMQWPMLKGMYYRVTDSPTAPDGIAWRSDLATALADAEKSKKPVLVDFSASWCPPCRVMKHEVWPDKDVGVAVEAAYVPLLLDIDQSEGKAAAERYGVTTIPAILVLDAKGNVLRKGSFMSKKEMLQFLKEKP